MLFVFCILLPLVSLQCSFLEAVWCGDFIALMTNELYFKHFSILIFNTLPIYRFNPDKHELSEVINNFQECKGILRPEILRRAGLSEVGIHHTFHFFKDAFTLSFSQEFFLKCQHFPATFNTH